MSVTTVGDVVNIKKWGWRGSGGWKKFGIADGNEVWSWLPLTHKHTCTQRGQSRHQHPSFKRHFRSHLSHSNKNASCYNTLSGGERGRQSYGMDRLWLRANRKKMQEKQIRQCLYYSLLFCFFRLFKFLCCFSKWESHEFSCLGKWFIDSRKLQRLIGNQFCHLLATCVIFPTGVVLQAVM